MFQTHICTSVPCSSILAKLQHEVLYTPEVEMKSENAPGKGGVLWKSCFSCAIFRGVT